MSADLIRVRFSGKAIALLETARALSPTLGQRIEQIGLKVLNQAAVLGQEACRANVPIDTGQLRQDIIVSEAASFQDIVVVSVALVDHVNRSKQKFYRRGGVKNSSTTVIGSPALADLLNYGTMHNGKTLNHRKPSLGVGPFSGGRTGPTAGWEEDARIDFLNALKRMASGR